MAKITEDRIAINSWLYPSKDAVLIKTLEHYEGDKAGLVIRALENYFALPAEDRRDPTERLVEEIALLRQAVIELPSRLLNQLTTALSGLVIRNRGNDNPAEADTQPVVTDEELAKRRKNRKENRW